MITKTASELTSGDKTRDGSVVAEVRAQSTGWVKLTWSNGHSYQVPGCHVFEMARKR